MEILKEIDLFPKEINALCPMEGEMRGQVRLLIIRQREFMQNLMELCLR